MAQHESGKLDGSRRSFLGAAGGLGALGALAVMFGKGAASVPLPLPAALPPDSLARGYRETEHVRKYYRSARYW